MKDEKMYKIINNGKIFGIYRLFIDAWLDAIELKCFSYIEDNNGYKVIINPFNFN
jgi:hypothetical protein